MTAQAIRSRSTQSWRLAPLALLLMASACFRDFNPTAPEDELVLTILEPAPGGTVDHQPFTVRGTVDREATVTINGDPATLSGLEFTASVSLPLGSSVLTVKAVGVADPTKTASRTIIVRFQPPPPVLTIDAPTDGQLIQVMPVTVSGSVDIPADVTVNGQPATMSGQSFTHPVPLVFGANTIVVVATDRAYPTNTSSQILTVTYEPLRPGLVIEEPLDGEVMRQSPSLVRGTVALPSFVTVNGVDAQVDGLSFSAMLPLVLGDNAIAVTAVDATDPANSETLTITVSYPPIVIDIDNSVVGSDGAFEIVPRVDGSSSLAGRYQPVDYPATLELTSGDLSQTLSSSDGTFRTLLPPSAEAWVITLTEVAPNPRSATARVRATADTTPPIFTIDGGLVQIVDAATFILAGTAIDEQSQVATLEATSSRHRGVPFAVIQGASGGFYVELPVERGDNVITLRAVDQYGNATEIEVILVRPSGLAPTLVVTSPLPGTVVQTATIAVEGLVYTSQPPEAVRVRLGEGLLVFPQATAREGVLSFRFDEVPLREGYNALWVRVETLVGNDDVTVPIAYLKDATDPNDTRPVIVVVTPLPGFATADPTVNVAGSILRGEGTVSLELDGVSLPLFGEQRRFRHAVDIASLPEGPITLQLTATDSQGQVGTATVRVMKDLGIPVITITTPGILEQPDVNRVVETPFVLEGTVRDDNLGSLMLNDVPVRVLPTAEPNVYSFRVRVDLPNGEQRTATLVANDRAGNSSTKALDFLAEVPVGIEIVSPRNGAELLASGTELPLDTVARLTGLLATHRVRGSVDNGAAVMLTVAGGTASGQLVSSTTDGNHHMAVEVIDEADAVVARARAYFTVVNEDNIPLQVVRTVPDNGATGVEPNVFLTLHFNKAIDPSLLSLEVRETAHGLTYDLSQGQGADFTARSLPPLVEVHRDQEVLGATPSLFPGNRMISYYLARDLAYKGKAYVTATYDGEELARFSFEVRALPTFVQGLISDQFLSEVSGVTVKLLDRAAVTDANGSFAFGFGDPPEQTLPPGRHRLLINPGLAHPRYGSVELWVNIEAGRLVQVGTTPLPVLNPDIPFRRLVSGAASQTFAEGALTLDTVGATLRFPDGRAQGDLHVQFMPVHQIPASSQSYATPQWMYAVQPVGVELRGTMRMRVQMPPLFGSHAYVPASGTHVLLLGLDSNAMQLVPVGVGTISGTQIEGTVQNTRLDFLGYAMVASEQQPLLARFVSGELTLQQLNGALAGAAP